MSLIENHRMMSYISRYVFDDNPSLRELFVSLLNVNAKYLGLDYDNDIPHSYEMLVGQFRQFYPREYSSLAMIADLEARMGLLGYDDAKLRICRDISELFHMGILGRSIEDTVYSFYDNGLEWIAQEIKEEFEAIKKKGL